VKWLKYIFSLVLISIFLYADSNSSFLRHFIKNNLVEKNIDCPVIETRGISITFPDCGKSNGSITGITINSTGTKITYTWRDANNNVVGKKLDLTGIPEGQYILEVSDNSGCTNPVFSNAIVVESAHPVTIDASRFVVTEAGCSNDGSISGLKVTGASIFEWRNFLTGTVTSTPTSDLIGVPPGTYQLNASNIYGCSAKSDPYTVQSKTEVPRISQVNITDPKCGSVGTIDVTLTVRIGEPQLNFYFAGPGGTHVTDGLIFSDHSSPTIHANGVTGGTYGLYVYSDNSISCPVLLGQFKVKEAQLYIVVDTVVNDKCNMHNGAVALTILGQTDPRDSKYTWTDISTNKQVSKAKNLFLAGAGTYAFEVDDPAGCIARDTFTIKNTSPALIPPQADGTILCLPGQVKIVVKNLVTDTAGTYRLYANPGDSIPLVSNVQGIFYRQVKKTTDFYLAYHQDDCESERTKVTEVVVADVNIPNAFTPNNDGINDYWNIKGIEDFPGASVDIFNRSGQLVYHSINYSKPFDGRYNGKELPTGVYFYVIDLKQPICFGKVSGSLTIIK
jgi:gliding motility-associated-like protein